MGANALSVHLFGNYILFCCMERVGICVAARPVCVTYPAWVNCCLTLNPSEGLTWVAKCEMVQGKCKSRYFWSSQGFPFNISAAFIFIRKDLLVLYFIFKCLLSCLWQWSESFGPKGGCDAILRNTGNKTARRYSPENHNQCGAKNSWLADWLIDWLKIWQNV